MHAQVRRAEHLNCLVAVYMLIKGGTQVSKSCAEFQVFTFSCRGDSNPHSCASGNAHNLPWVLEKCGCRLDSSWAGATVCAHSSLCMFAGSMQARLMRTVPSASSTRSGSTVTRRASSAHLSVAFCIYTLTSRDSATEDKQLQDAGSPVSCASRVVFNAHKQYKQHCYCVTASTT